MYTLAGGAGQMEVWRQCEKETDVFCFALSLAFLALVCRFAFPFASGTSFVVAEQ